MTDLFGERRATAKAVKADVDAIFGEPPPQGARTTSKLLPLGGSSGKRPSRAAGIGASVAVGLAGIAVGALLTRDQPAAAPPVQASAGTLEVELTPQAPVVPLVIEPPAAAPKVAEASKPPPLKASRGDCARAGGRQCTYSAVLSADASLRQAYRRAGRAGVSRHELAAYRAKWSRLRRAGSHDPDRVVRGYRAMAADLNRLARERRA